jgi:tetratricopeptide (TPR) repeat protein
VPNALEKNVQQRLQEAASLRDRGQFDQALAAYQDIYAKNPRLSSVNLVVADVYRRKAAQASDDMARQALLDRAVDAYNEVLKFDDGNERARAEIASLRSGRN